MGFHRAWVGACLATTVVACATSASGAIIQYMGAVGSPAVDPVFDSATASHVKQFIDFDDDGFDLAPHAYTPIPPDHYALLGVTLLNLDARSVGTEPWAHSPPIGAWHTGFSNPITTPYSFVFTQPVASFGMFANDVEGTISVTVLNAGTSTFTIPFQGGADIVRFHGFVADSNVIQRIDFMSTDYHIIDDVQFGSVIVIPEPASGCLLLCGALTFAVRRGRRAEKDTSLWVH
jgi:hypothetical protein